MIRYKYVLLGGAPGYVVLDLKHAQDVQGHFPGQEVCTLQTFTPLV